mgnify:CR=1 FL=1
MIKERKMLSQEAPASAESEDDYSEFEDDFENEGETAVTGVLHTLAEQSHRIKTLEESLGEDLFPKSRKKSENRDRNSSSFNDSNSSSFNNNNSSSSSSNSSSSSSSTNAASSSSAAAFLQRTKKKKKKKYY